MKMGEDGGDGASVAPFAGRLGAPSAGIKMREQELVHRIVDAVDFEQDVVQVGRGGWFVALGEFPGNRRECYRGAKRKDNAIEAADPRERW